MTLVELELPEWDKVQQRDRLLGTSLTGWKDAMDMLGYTVEEENALKKVMGDTSRDEAHKYAKQLRVNTPMFATAIKPEGCWTKEFTRVTDEGILTVDEIEEISNKEEGFHDVKDKFHANGNRITKAYKNEVKDILKVKLQNGRILKVSKPHPISVNGEWVEAQDLKLEDKLDYKLGSYTNNKEHSFKDISVEGYRSDANDYPTPTEMSSELAWLIGAYWANGSFTTNNRIKFHSGHYKVNQEVQRIWKKLFNVDTSIVKSTDRDSYTQDFASVKITDWFIANGLDKYSGESMTVPKAVRMSSVNSIRSFIIGFADNDGHFHSKSFCIDTADEAFARHLQEIGEAVGFSFDISINKSRKGAYTDNYMYKLHMSRAFSNPEVIEFTNKHSIKASYQGKVETGIITSKNPYTVVGIEILEDQQTYDIEVEDEHWYYQGGLKSHNTLSQVMGGVSSGLHWSHSPYYRRTIRINAHDPLVKVAEHLDWHIHAEVGTNGKMTEEELAKPEQLEAARTKVVSFPIASGAKRTKDDISVDEQFDNYFSFQDLYTDMNTSNTITVKPREWKQAQKRVWDGWNNFVGVSFLSHDGGSYQLAPYSAITKEEYEEMMDGLQPFEPDLLYLYEQSETEADMENMESCESGVCGIR